MFRRGEVEMACMKWWVLAVPSKVSPPTSAPTPTPTPFHRLPLHIKSFHRSFHQLTISSYDPIQALVLDHMIINPTAAISARLAPTSIINVDMFDTRHQKSGLRHCSHQESRRRRS